mgnify:CR=1 FL=1
MKQKSILMMLVLLFLFSPFDRITWYMQLFSELQIRCFHSLKRFTRSILSGFESYGRYIFVAYACFIIRCIIHQKNPSRRHTFQVWAAQAGVLSRTIVYIDWKIRKSGFIIAEFTGSSYHNS